MSLGFLLNGAPTGLVRMAPPEQRHYSAMTADAELRARLIAMRETLVEGLAAEPALDGGMLALLGNVGAALDALDRTPPEGAEPARWAVVKDDGREIRIVLYREGGEAAAVVLDPRGAVHLAVDLLKAASRHLADLQWSAEIISANSGTDIQSCPQDSGQSLTVSHPCSHPHARGP